MTELPGHKHDDGKTRYDLVPDWALESLAEVYSFGAKKYAEYNWRAGMRWSRVYSALMRHLIAWRKGERYDSDSQKSHLSHVAWNAITLLEYDRLGIGIDDRLPAIDADPAYLAGMVDGEGTITVTRTRKATKGGAYKTRWSVLLYVYSSNKHPLNCFKEKFGGHIQSCAPRTTHPIKQRRPVFSWQASGNIAATAIGELLPYLKIKHHQAVLALKLWGTMDKGCRNTPEIARCRDDLTLEIWNLNRPHATEANANKIKSFPALV